jgi:hypothetical protein
MSVLEKDRPKAGRALWGDAFVERINVAQSKLPENVKENMIKDGILSADSYDDEAARDDFSIKIRVNNDSVQTNNFEGDVNVNQNTTAIV